jgi:uncharacterized membrane protein YebE (DUF533 family)
MKEINTIINGLSKSGFLSGLAGGVLGGAVTGAVSNKKVKKVGGTVLKAGALAAVGGLAWKAYKAYNQNQQANQVNQPEIPLQQNDFEKVIEHQQTSGSMLILQAMIAAAYADGHMDGDERTKIFEQVGTLQLSDSDKASLFDAMEHPLSAHEVAAQVSNMETAIEVYTASLLAIDRNQPESADYLQQLSLRLNLSPELVAQVHHQASV